MTTVPTLDPGLMLFGFLPPLLFDAAFRLDTREARLLLRPILLLALPGTLLTALVVGGIVAIVLTRVFGTWSPLGVADACSLRAGGHRRKREPDQRWRGDHDVHGRAGLALTGRQPLEVLRIFGQEVVGGVLIELGLRVFTPDRRRRRPPHRDDAFSGAGVWQLRCRPVAARLRTAGVCSGAASSTEVTGARSACPSRRVGSSTISGSFLGFVANAIVFVLVGFSANLASLAAHAWPAAVAIVAVLLARFVLLGAPSLVRRRGVLATSRPSAWCWPGAACAVH